MPSISDIINRLEALKTRPITHDVVKRLYRDAINLDETVGALLSEEQFPKLIHCTLQARGYLWALLRNISENLENPKEDNYRKRSNMVLAYMRQAKAALQLVTTED